MTHYVFNVLLHRQNRMTKKKHFSITVRGLKLFQEEQLSRQEMSVVWQLLREFPGRQIGALVNSETLAATLTIDRSRVLRCLRRLTEIGLLLRGELVNRRYQYTFNKKYIVIIEEE